MINAGNPRGLTKEEAERAMYYSAGLVKMVTGVGNSAAHLVMLHAHDQIKRHPNYRHQVKRAYKDAMEEMERYRNRLLHPTEVRFFHLADLKPKDRVKYAPDATDRDYFAFWEASGAQAYERTKPFITSLWNKYRLSLMKHGTGHADELAWAMTAAAALHGAVDLYEHTIKDCCIGHGLPEKLLRHFFCVFDLSPVFTRWERALNMTDPATDDYELDEVEERNIQNGLNDLRDRWVNPDNLFGSTLANIEDYDEIFSTKGHQKKSARVMADLLSKTREELENDRRQELLERMQQR